MRTELEWESASDKEEPEMYRAYLFDGDYSLWVTLNDKARYEININNAEFLCVLDGDITYTSLNEAKHSAELLFIEYIGKHIRSFKMTATPKFVSLTESSAGLAGLTELGTVYLYCQATKTWRTPQ